MGQQCCCEKADNNDIHGMVKMSKSHAADPQLEEEYSPPTISVVVQSGKKVETLNFTLTTSTSTLRQLLQARGFIDNAGAHLIIDGVDLRDEELSLQEAGFEDGSSLICREEDLLERFAAQKAAVTTTTGPARPPAGADAGGDSAPQVAPVADAPKEVVEDSGSGGRTFMVEVHRASERPEASKLGLVVYAREGEEHLRIRAISPGLITEWNTQSSGPKVTKNTVILSVNGMKEHKDCAEELRRATDLQLEMQDILVPFR